MVYSKWAIFLALIFAFISPVWTQSNNPNGRHANKFEQLGTILPTPNEFRNASGAPGSKYWQQKVDYHIKCTLNEEKNQLTGTEKITYHNQSPDVLKYLWLQLDENQHSSINNANYQNESKIPRQFTDRDIERFKQDKGDNGYGHKIASVTDANGKSLKYMINRTMMRVDLDKPLQPGEKFVFNVAWSYNIADRMERGGRGGLEYFPEDKNHLYTITQWYPRLCVYSDFDGWQNQQFSGRAEFALQFGDFLVEMTVPADHIVSATGECQNYDKVLTPAQLKRWEKAQQATEPMEIVTLEEAKNAEKTKSKDTKTWIYKADNVRDFAWGSSRKFVWDAMSVNIEGNKVMAMSYYPKESYGLYRKYSTKAVAHTLEVYSSFTFPYPYPVAISVEASNGMEYPMICFNYGRTEKDGTYSESIKNGMIAVIIHEVGHNFFPMIVNSDERQWSWMDEGMNTFLEYIADELWDNKFPSRRGPAHTIVDYMKLPKEQLEPIMTNSDNIIHFGPNAYGKPATGLNILRETIMGRELFDHAFKEFARRWAFKHPTPADFFRTMEDASGEDLSWFWRGWFYTTDACDISIDTMIYATADLESELPKERTTTRSIAKPEINRYDDISKIRNREDKNIVFATDRDTTLRDFYWYYDRDKVQVDTASYTFTAPSQYEKLDKKAKKDMEDIHIYELKFSNKGGLVMPIILEWTYKDGTKEIERIPAQIWRKNESSITKSFIKDKEVASVVLDPYKETADIDESNNTWNKPMTTTKFKAYKQKQSEQGRRGAPQGHVNPMQRSKRT